MMAQCNKWGNSPLLKLENGEYHIEIKGEIHLY